MVSEWTVSTPPVYQAAVELLCPSVPDLPLIQENLTVVSSSWVSSAPPGLVADLALLSPQSSAVLHTQGLGPVWYQGQMLSLVTTTIPVQSTSAGLVPTLSLVPMPTLVQSKSVIPLSVLKVPSTVPSLVRIRPVCWTADYSGHLLVPSGVAPPLLPDCLEGSSRSRVEMSPSPLPLQYHSEIFQDLLGITIGTGIGSIPSVGTNFPGLAPTSHLCGIPIHCGLLGISGWFLIQQGPDRLLSPGLGHLFLWWSFHMSHLCYNHRPRGLSQTWFNLFNLLIQSNVLPQEIPVVPLPSATSSPDDATMPESSSPELEDLKSFHDLLRWMASALGIQAEFVQEKIQKLLDILQSSAPKRIALSINEVILELAKSL